MGGATVEFTGPEGAEHTRRLRHQVQMARQIQKYPIGSDPASLRSGIYHVKGAFTKNRFWAKSCPKKMRGIRLRTSRWETKPWDEMFDHFKIYKVLTELVSFESS